MIMDWEDGIFLFEEASDRIMSINR